MKTIALLAGLVFIALGIAGFAKLVAMAPMYATVLVVAGIAFAVYGLSRRHELVPPRTPGNDMRDFV